MDFTHGIKENRFYRDEKLQEEKNIYERRTTSVSSTPARGVQKEQMFEKVVTPSDVGKLNRLVIPKQHAEKFFPLGEMGLLLNFEDRNGKPWRFRYSYWNSSQSYVMTKGWSRFVKEHRLDAGDTVSFGRAVGDTATDRLFIDWKRRALPSAAFSIPCFSSSPATTHNHPYVSFSRSTATPWAASRLFVTGSASITAPSVPVAGGKAADGTKHVRLFGVNLEQPLEAANNQ